MGNECLVSIIIPAYNTEKTLERCVSSALRQTYSNIEIVIIDDGSVDGTLAIADGLASVHTQIRAIHQENVGLSGARNAGIEASVGELIFFLDSDDYIEADEIEKLVTAMNQTGADIVVGGLKYVTSEEILLGTITQKNQVFDERSYWDCAYYDSLVKHVMFVVSCGKLFSRAVFQDERFDVGKIHEDEFIIHRLVANSASIAFADTAGYIYVQNQESIVHTPRASSILDGCEAISLRTEHFICRRWPELAWKSLIECAHLLARSIRHKAAREERERYSTLIRRWRELYRKSSQLGGSTTTQKMKCRLFLLSPKAFSILVGMKEKHELANS